MSQEKAMLMMLKGAMSELEGDEQARTKELISRIDAILEEAGELAPLVIGIASLSYAVQVEE